MNLTDANFFLDSKLLENLKLSFHIQAQLKSSIQEEPEERSEDEQDEGSPDHIGAWDITNCRDYIILALRFYDKSTIFLHIVSFLPVGYQPILEYIQKTPSAITASSDKINLITPRYVVERVC
jgi:hypothetical protein